MPALSDGTGPKQKVEETMCLKRFTVCVANLYFHVHYGILLKFEPIVHPSCAALVMAINCCSQLMRIASVDAAPACFRVQSTG